MNLLTAIKSFFPTDRRILDRLEQMETNIMIDLTRIRASIEKERTENASLRALVAGQSQAIRDLSAQLAAAGTDAAALAQVQADLNALADGLDADDEDTAAALSANVAPSDDQQIPTPTSDT